MKRTKVKGANTPGTVEDDGIRVRRRMTYVDMVRAEYELERPIVDPVDPLDTAMDAARRYLEHVAAWDPATRKAAGPGEDCAQRNDERAAWRLHAELGNLRAALDGGDVRHAARAGVSFGKALEEMRVRLGGSTATRAGRKTKKGAKDGHAATHGTEAEKQARWASYRATYAEIKARKPHAFHSDIVRLTAEKHGVSEKTIKRHCPRK